jgi:membrane dipeptidase
MALIKKARYMKALIVIAALLVLGAGVFFFVVPGMVEKNRNPVLNPPPYTANERARTLHGQLQVADLHADSLLWNRDLLERGERGQVDIPRLIEGNVALQAFTIVTKSPRDMNIEHNTADTDNITPLAIAQRWPMKSWNSLAERALHQAHKLDDAARRSGGRFTLIRTAADLDAYLQRRAREPGITAGFLGIEGAHALDDRLDNIDRFFDAGVRMMAPTHFFDNEIGGSAHGVEKGGLTDKGREMIRRMEAKKMLLDLAHASPRTFDDAVAMSTRPVVVSHTGVKGTCDNARNLGDEQLRAIARTGGLVGIGYWETAVCGSDAAAVARAIIHAARVAGSEHVGLGSDYDGAVGVPFDTSGVVLVTEALLQQGMSENDVKLVMGGNALRLLRKVLP